MPRHSLFALYFSLIILGLSVFLCTTPSDPLKQIENADITISSDSSVMVQSDSVDLEFKLMLPHKIDSVIIDYDDGTFDTIYPVEMVSGNETVNYNVVLSHKFASDGTKQVTATAHLGSLTKTAKYTITIHTPANLSNQSIQVSGNPVEGAPFAFFISASGTEPLQYTWYKDSAEIPLSDSATLLFSSLELSDTGTYYCVITNEWGNDTSLEYTIHLVPVENHPPRIKNDKQVLVSGAMEPDSTIILSIEAEGSPVLIYQWFKNDTELSDETSDALTLSSLQVSASGEYYCIVQNDAGFDTSGIFTVTISPSLFSITVTCGAHGKIAPLPDSGKVVVQRGENQEFIISPDTGYHISEVLIDGNADSSAAAEKRYTFSDVQTHHTIDVSFEINTCIIDTTIIGAGTVTADPSIGAPIPYGTQVTLTAIADSGYYFAGWSGDTSSDAETMFFSVADDRSLTATFAQIGRYAVNVTVDSGNGTVTRTPEQDDYVEGDTVVLKAVPDAGHTFNKIWAGDTAATGDSMVLVVTRSYSIHVGFGRMSYSITASAGAGGSLSPSGIIRVLYGDDTTFICTPNTGYFIKNITVDGITDSDAISAKQKRFTNISDNHEIHVSFAIDTFTVSFNSNGGTAIAAQRIAYNQQATEPQASPTRSGYVFNGWYTTSTAVTGTLFDFSNPITTPRTLYAGWTAVYRVFYDANGGSGDVPVDTVLHKNGDVVKVLDGTGFTRDGYTFSEWSTTRSGAGTSRTPGSTYLKATGNDTLYARWNTKQYSISYDLNGGSNIDTNPSTYNIESQTITLQYPTKVDYTFAGWFSDSALTQPVTQIATGTYGDLKFYAGWTWAWTITDIDGNTYPAVQIGDQVWTSVNLRVTRYNDGTPIANVPDSAEWAALSSAAFCFLNNTNDSAAHVKFGALYNAWAMIHPNIAPPGWHVSTKTDWDTLQNFLISNGYNYDQTVTDNKIAKALAARTDWNNTTYVLGTPGSELLQNNTSGFSALPGGYRLSDGAFFGNFKNVGAWRSVGGYTYDISAGNVTLKNDGGRYLSRCGFSLRLVKD